MSASKAFSNSYNKSRSAQDNTNKKKAETIFMSARNKSVNKMDGKQYIDPVLKTTNGFLAAVGGYNVNSYDMLTNVAKGQSYIATKSVTINGSSVLLPMNECKLNIRSNKPNSSYDIFEGSYLQKSEDLNDCNCNSIKREEFTNYDPSNILQSTNNGSNTEYSYIQLANSNKLQNFYLHRKLQIDCSGN